MPRNMLSEAQDKFWYGYAQHHSPFEGKTTEREFCNLTFAAGARWAMQQSSQLSPHIAKFIEMMILLGYFDHDSFEVVSAPSDGATGDPKGAPLNTLPAV